MSRRIKSWLQLEDEFEELLNETYPPVNLGGHEYEYARTWRKVDPIAYYQDLLAYANGLGIDTDKLKGACSF